MSEGVQRISIAVLISGTGSNLKALVEARERGELDIEINLVISNHEHAPGLDHARNAGIPFAIVNQASCRQGETEDQAVAARLRETAPDLVLLSGYMRILSPELAGEFLGRMINQHPSLLPKFKGLHTYQRVLEAGDVEHGASIHFVTAELDGGPVIAQARIPVEAGDTDQTLAARLGPVEHQLLIAVIELFGQRRVTMQQAVVYLDGEPILRPLELMNDALEQ